MTVYCNDCVLSQKVQVADSFFTRLKGLMGKKHLEEGEGLLLLHCPAIHCFFMKITIYAVYLSEDMTVLATETLTPWKIGRHVKHARHVLELAAGTGRVSAGDLIKLQGDD